MMNETRTKKVTGISPLQPTRRSSCSDPCSSSRGRHAAPLARSGASVRLLGPGRLQAVRALPRRFLALRQAALQARDLQGGLPGTPAKPCPPSPHAPEAQPASALAQVWTYAYLCLLPALSALAEFVGYRWVVLLGVLGRLATLALLLAPPTNGSLPLMKLQEVFIAAGFAAHPALMAIAYRTLPAEAYSRAAGFTACAGVVAQARTARIAHAPPATAAAPLPCLDCSACSRYRSAHRSWASCCSCSSAARHPPSRSSSPSLPRRPRSRAASRSHCPRPGRARRSSSRPARPAAAAPASSARRCRPGPRCSAAPSRAPPRSTWA